MHNRKAILHAISECSLLVWSILSTLTAAAVEAFARRTYDGVPLLIFTAVFIVSGVLVVFFWALGLHNAPRVIYRLDAIVLVSCILLIVLQRKHLLRSNLLFVALAILMLCALIWRIRHASV